MQPHVKAVYTMLKQKGVPVWMDINGGMSKDIYDSVRPVAGRGMG